MFLQGWGRAEGELAVYACIHAVIILIPGSSSRRFSATPPGRELRWVACDGALCHGGRGNRMMSRESWRVGPSGPTIED